MKESEYLKAQNIAYLGVALDALRNVAKEYLSGANGEVYREAVSAVYRIRDAELKILRLKEDKKDAAP